MGFKLGKAKQPQASGGVMRDKLSFKKEIASIPGTPIIRTDLADGILGEANLDGSIYLSNTVKPNSILENEVLLHEMRHATDIRIGKLAYGDDFVKYNGITYPRETRDGKDMIKHNGRWKEAGDNFPWENDANNKKNGNI